METKKDIRTSALQIRSQLPKEVRRANSRKINELLMASECMRANDYFFCYAPVNSEVDITEFTEFLIRCGKHIALPKVSGEKMRFVEVSDLSGQLQKGAFQIMEPVSDIEAVWDQAVVLVPGLAFDLSGNRIGYGKGYYDRYFSCHSCKLKIGVAYDETLVDHIPAVPHDLVMDMLCTQKNLIALASSRRI